jgi:hypothetical protein
LFDEDRFGKGCVEGASNAAAFARFVEEGHLKTVQREKLRLFSFQHFLLKFIIN